MVLQFVHTLSSFLAIFFFVFLPIIFVINLVSGFRQGGKEGSVEEEGQIHEDSTFQKEDAPEEPVIDVYRTVKKEAGSYVVVAPDKSEAIVIKVNTHDQGKYWIAILATKEGEKSDRVSTKKEAVALAIEMLKKEKEINNGS